MKRAFTLIELLVVITIILFLTALISSATIKSLARYKVQTQLNRFEGLLHVARNTANSLEVQCCVEIRGPLHQQVAEASYVDTDGNKKILGALIVPAGVMLGAQKEFQFATPFVVRFYPDCSVSSSTLNGSRETRTLLFYCTDQPQKFGPDSTDPAPSTLRLLSLKNGDLHICALFVTRSGMEKQPTWPDIQQLMENPDTN